MDFLRPDHDDAAFEDDLEPTLDDGVIGRLSAYGSDPVEPGPAERSPEPAAEEEPVTQRPRDRGVPAWSGEPPAVPPAFSLREEGVTHAPGLDGSSARVVADTAGESTEVVAEVVAESSVVAVAEETSSAGEAQSAGVEDEGLESEAALESVPEPVEVRAVEEGHAAEAAGETLAEQDEPEAALAVSGDSGGGETAADVTVDAGDGDAKKARRAIRLRRGAGKPAGEQAHVEEPKKKDKARRRDSKKAKKLVGLKIGASQIAAAQVVNNGAPEVVELHRAPLEPGIVVFGEIRDPDALGDALKEFFASHKLPKRGIRLGISNNRVGVRIFEVDGVDDREHLENAIRFRAEEVLPIPLDQAVLDYAILDESVLDDGTPRKRILLVVAYREVVDRYLQACARAGLQIAGVDHEAFALLRSLEVPAERDAEQGALVAVAIGHDRTTIAVSNGRQCEFARVLDWGGWSLNIAIARELHRAPSEVEPIKRRLSFARDTEVDGLTPEQVAKARHAMARALEAFARELISSLQFYQAQPGALGIGEVVVTGGTAHVDGLPGALGEIVGVPIRLGDPFKRLKVGTKVEHLDERGSLAIAIGLGIED